MQFQKCVLFVMLAIISKCTPPFANNLTPNTPYLPKIPTDENFGLLYQIASSDNWRSVAITINNLPPDNSFANMLKATIANQKSQPYKACLLLNQTLWQLLPNNWQAHFFNQLTKCQTNSNTLSLALTTLNHSYNTLESMHNKQHLLTIWDTLYHTSNKQLLNLKQQTQNSTTLQEWIKIIQIAKNQQKSQAQEEQLATWLTNNPNHPANAFIKNPTNQIHKPKIALLLPLKGPFAPASHAIEDGFFAAFYQNKNNQLVSPSSITVYDTSSLSISEIYSKAQANNIDIAIGPLSKANVANWANLNQEITTIALNSIPEKTDNIFELDLRAEDESRQVAEFAYNKGLRRFFIFSIESPKNQRIVNSFKEHWLKLGGTITQNIVITNPENASKEIKEKLHISQSQARALLVKQRLQKKIRTTPRRRQDIDAVFLAMDQEQAKNIAPLLKYFYIGHIPIFAISTIFQKQNYNFTNYDLSGITFCTSSWIKSNIFNHPPANNKTLQDQINLLWPKKVAKNKQFFAIGLDAYLLAFRLNHLILFPFAYLKGSTGDLYLTADNTIKRVLSWVTIKNGKNYLLTSK